MRGKVGAMEHDVAVEDLPDRIVTWPDRWPKRARPATMPAKRQR